MSWEVSGTYYEACNCEAVCPCRNEGSRRGGRSTYETCDFVLSWKIDKGHVDGRDLSGLSAVLAGSYSDDETGSPWRVVLFVDETADADGQEDLADVFLGRRDGDTHRLYGRAIQDVSMIRSAAISVVHEPGRWRIGVATFIEVRSTVVAISEGPVTCGITAHLPGTELIADALVVAAPPFEWELRERCAFTSPFAYSSDG